MRASESFAAREVAVRERIHAAERLIVALDVAEPSAAFDIVGQLDGIASFFKLGPWLSFGRGFNELLDRLIDSKKRVFLDSKGCDIPETMRAGVASAASRGISFLTIHGNGDVTESAMRAALEGKEGSDLKLFAVTVLTSHDSADLQTAGYGPSVVDLALRRAEKAMRVGCDGVITSGHEASAIKQKTLGLGREFLVVTPGIRPAGTKSEDHKRAMTPGMAVTAGADYLVVGRPIIRNENPAKAAAAIIAEMQTAFDDLP
jgi:orotidine-5'-phosphate decarboxylase